MSLAHTRDASHNVSYRYHFVDSSRATYMYCNVVNEISLVYVLLLLVFKFLTKLKHKQSRSFISTKIYSIHLFLLLLLFITSTGHFLSNYFYFIGQIYGFFYFYFFKERVFIYTHMYRILF